MKTTHTLQSAEAEIVYDVRGPLPAADARPPLFMIGQPMQASGFDALAAQLSERTWPHMTRGASVAAPAKTAGSTMRPRFRPTTCTP